MKTIVFSIIFIFITAGVFAQQAGTDTIFRAGANAAEINGKKNPFINYTGKIIRHIRIKNVGFEGDIKDTAKVNSGFGVTIGNALHKNTITG
ncbi:MAG: hypothetical protein IPP72_19360 [Chitinophagaceae bacterium]|nr:hypothetical protein [Chitinophagaceae bacterium]